MASQPGKRPIRVAHLVLSLNMGGLERFVVEFVSHSSPKFAHTVMCMEEAGVIGKTLTDIPLTVFGKKPGLRLLFSLELRKALLGGGFDVVHSHNLNAHFYASLAVPGTGIAHLTTKHGRNFPYTANKLVLNRIACLNTNHIVAVSDDVKRFAIDVEKSPPGKVSTILNGVDSTRFRRRDGFAGLLEQYPAEGDALKIVCVARFNEVKNHALLLRACSLLKNDAVPFKVFLVGDGPLRQELEALARTLGIADSTVFAGMRGEVENVLQGMDVFVLPSLSEGVSLTLLEAMACELPVVATDVGGNSEVVAQSHTGLLVPSGDAAALALALKALWSDPALAKSYGENGRKRVLEKFEMSNTVADYEQLYMKLVGRPE